MSTAQGFDAREVVSQRMTRIMYTSGTATSSRTAITSELPRTQLTKQTTTPDDMERAEFPTTFVPAIILLDDYLLNTFYTLMSPP